MSSPAAADENRVAPPLLQRLHAALSSVFQRHYPKAASTATAEGVHFETDTRLFLIHRSLMTGEWQEASEVKGPNRKGILCDIALVQGKYDGQAILPQTFNDRYFKTLVLAVAPPSQEAYLYVHLSYPDEVSPGFLKEFTDLLAGSWEGGTSTGPVDFGAHMAVAAEEAAPQARAVVERYLELPFPEKDPFGKARIVRLNTLDELKPFSDLAVREIARTLPGVTDPRQRMELAEALRLFQTRESAAKLSELLGDPNEKVRWQAIVGLGMMAGRVVRLGAQSVQRGGGVAPKVEGLVPQLIKAAGDENPGNRTAALSALADTLEPAAIAEIRRRLKDENAEVRFEAACLLTGFQDASGLGELQKALARLRSEPESNLLVMIRTERLLVSFERITGKSFGPIPMEPWASSQSGAEEEAKPRYKQLLDAWAAWWAWEPTAK